MASDVRALRKAIILKKAPVRFFTLFFAVLKLSIIYILLSGMEKVNCDLMTKIGFADNRLMQLVKEGSALLA